MLVGLGVMQIIPTNWSLLFGLASKVYRGLVALAESIPVTMVNPEEMLAGKTAFKEAGDSFNAARASVADAYKVSKPAQKALRAWLVMARTVLTMRMGRRWTAKWVAAGWVEPCTAVPDTNDARLALGISLATYFTENPGYEVAEMGVTAAKAIELTDAASAGQLGVSRAEQALKNADHIRLPAREHLLDLIRTVIANLDRKLEPNDPRWLAFGLEMPATPRTPRAPTGLRATVVGDEIVLKCDETALATRYRFRSRLAGAGASYGLAGSSPEPRVALKGVSAGVTLEIMVQAVNGPLQSVASAPILVTMPASVGRLEEAVSQAEPALLAEVRPNEYGNRRVNGRGDALPLFVSS